MPDLTDTSHTVTGLTNGTRYYFKVRAVNVIGQSAASAQVFATPQVSATGAAPAERPPVIRYSTFQAAVQLEHDDDGRLRLMSPKR